MGDGCAQVVNVPYDSGLVFYAHADAHRAAMSGHADYLVHAQGGERDRMDWNPEFSRRARGFPVYAALRAWGRSGIADLIDRCCMLAQRFATQLADHDGVEVLNDVTLNQVLVRFLSPMGTTTPTPVPSSAESNQTAPAG
jgi:glutamate/tyrosine decarboxylase-like PLP-dependent enzyme